ncbi:MAG: PQQ-binding-like beta-propeller repeat protein [Phycisphaerales bacterium]
MPALVVLCAFGSAVAGDWPTYMHDNARSGVTTETLALNELDEGWVYVSPAPPQVAWDGGAPWDSYRSSSSANVCELTPQRDFDFVFFVTVVGDRLYFGSSVTDSVHCLNTRTGRQKWFFTTNGPIRYPPSHDDGRLYFGSDDGYVYCINAGNGSFVWKYSPAGDTRLVGNNGSLIPMWPVRTGTAVLDGKVYFAASLVNWQTSYLCSLDAQTGSDSGAGLYSVSGGVTPMGAIMASATKLYLLQGRLSPYAFNRATGSVSGTFGDRGQSGCYALLTSDSRFVRGHAKVHAEGYELAEHNADTRDRIAAHPNGRRLIVSGDMAYLLRKTSLSAINRSNGNAIWSVPCDCPHALILAGDVLFAGGTNKVAAYSTANGGELWSRVVKGRIRGLAAAGGRLFVSTDTGNIHMFGRAYLPADLNNDGVVDLLDLAMFAGDYLKCTDPTNTQWPCEKLLDP